MRKTLLIILILILVFLAACNSESRVTQKPDISILQNPPTVTGENITDTSKEDVVIPYIPLSYAYKNFDSAYMQRWIDFIKEEFGIEFQIDLIASAFEDHTGSYMTELLNNKNVKGFAALNSSAHWRIRELSDGGLIMPLTDILENNKTWNSLPQEMKEMYNYSGDIWAIPDGYSYSPYYRIVRKEWLNNLNMNTPETFDELRLLFKRITFEDPDGDGINNSTGSKIKPYNVIDIFNNMDCFLQYVDNRAQVTSIAYDKNAGEFRDCMMDDRIKEPLLYIKSMLDEGIVEYNRPITIKHYTSAFYRQVQLNPDIWEPIWGYNGKNNNPISINNTGSYIVVAAGADNAESMVNKFIDVLYGNHEAYLCTLYGMPGEAYNVAGGIELLSDDMLKNQMPELIGYNPVLENEINYVNENGDGLPYWSWKYYQNEIEKLISLDDPFIIGPDIAFGVTERENYKNYSHNSNGDMIRGDELLGQFELIYGKIMNGFISVDEGIEEYRKRATKLGAEQYINELNTRMNAN